MAIGTFVIKDKRAKKEKKRKKSKRRERKVGGTNTPHSGRGQQYCQRLMEHEQVKYLFKSAKVTEEVKIAHYKNLERVV